MWTASLRRRKRMRAWLRLIHARRGNVAITFAFTLIPILALVGAAVDYSRANSIRTSLQLAVDATALMLSKNAPALTSDQMKTSAQTYFAAIFKRPDATNVRITTASYSATEGSKIVIAAAADMDTEFIRILGYKTINLGATSTAKWGSARLRVALVLDTTGSMSSSGKIDALKAATKNLLTQLQSAASVDGDVYVSIIPFSKDITLVSSNYTANWIDWTDWDAEPPVLDPSRGGAKPNNWSQIGPGSSCPFTSSGQGFKCTVGPRNDSATTSSIPSSGSYSGYICPDVDGGNKLPTKLGVYYNGCYDSIPTTTTSTKTICSGSGSCSCGNLSNCSCTGNGNRKVCTQTVTTTGAPYTHNWIRNQHNTWNGCVADRGTSTGPKSDYDRLVTDPSTSVTASLFPAEQYANCPSAVTGQSYSWSTLKSEVDDLSPNGSTNQPIGLVWGWQSLVGGGPLTSPAKSSSYTYNDVIILLSDGLNTQNRWYGNGSSTSTSVDARMHDSSGNGTCANIYAAGITLYTIQVNTGGDPTSTLLKSCAGSPSDNKFPDPNKFFLLTSANQIITTFDKIGSEITKLRIAQ
jgi:Flp pilus assembly protein TadG